LECNKAIPDSIGDICSIFEAKTNLWKIKMEYEILYKLIKEKKYCDINISELQSDIERMATVLTKSKAFLKDDNECSEIVSKQIREFRDVVICLSKLNQPYYDERHKQDINKILEFEFFFQKETKQDDLLMDEVKITTELRSDMLIGELID